MALGWGPCCGKGWEPGRERPAGELWPTVVFFAVAAIAVCLAVLAF